MTGYLSGIPQGGQTIASSQSQILNNFTQLNNVYTIDHVDYTIGAPDIGKHKQLRFPAAVSPSAPTGTNTVMFPGNVANRTVPQSAPSPYNTQIAPLFQNSVTTMLMGGINAFGNIAANGTIQSGFNIKEIDVVGTNQFTVKFASNLPSNAYCTFITVNDPNATPYGQQILVNDVAFLTFRILGVGANPLAFAGFYILIIGA